MVISLLLILATLGFGYWAYTQVQANQLQDGAMVQLQVGQTMLNVEVAASPESITQGLSGREAIGSDGLLFVLPTRTVPAFWMKDMQFNLDLVWIDQGQIVGITRDVPAPENASQPLPTYQPEQPVEWVLEVVAGTAAEWQIGDSIMVLEQ